MIVLEAIRALLKLKGTASLEEITSHTGCLSFKGIVKILNDNKKYLKFDNGVITYEDVYAMDKRRAYVAGKYYVVNEYPTSFVDGEFHELSFWGHDEFRKERSITKTLPREAFPPTFSQVVFNGLMRQCVIATDENIAALEALGCVREDKYMVECGWKDVGEEE